MRIALLLLIATCEVFAFTSFPRLASYNSPAGRFSLSPIPLSVLTYGSSYITNSDFYYQNVAASAGLFGDVWTATNINLISRVISGGSEITIRGTTVSYASPGIVSATFVVADIETGQESGTTFTKSTTFSTLATTNTYFSGYVVGSLAYHTYTNIIARTNGRNIDLWSVYPYSTADKNAFRRNPDCLITGISNLTAISQCNEFQGGRGQIPVTALTRRHGFSRGHGFGVDYGGTSITNWDGVANKEVVFVGHDNTIVTMLVSNRITFWDANHDYTVFIFTSDLPSSITPLKVTTNLSLISPSLYPWFTTNTQLALEFPRPVIYTEQEGKIDTSGNVSAGIPGFTYPSQVGGDSGSPNMILVDDDLVFFGGRTTSGPSAHMQGAMDALSVLSGLIPANYQMQWKDMSSFPVY